MKANMPLPNFSPMLLRNIVFRGLSFLYPGNSILASRAKKKKTRLSFVAKLLYNVDWKASDPGPKPQSFDIILHAWGIGKGAEDSEIQTVEGHAFESLKKYCAAHGKLSAWVMLYFGSHFQILAYEVGQQQLVAFFPLTNKKSRIHYVDIKSTVAEYKRSCEYMKKHLEPNTALFNKHMGWIEGTVQGDCPID